MICVTSGRGKEAKVARASWDMKMVDYIFPTANIYFFIIAQFFLFIIINNHLT